MEVGGAGRRRGRPPNTWGWEDGRGRGRLLFAGSSAPTRADPLGSCARWGRPSGDSQTVLGGAPHWSDGISQPSCAPGPRKGQTWVPSFFFFSTERGILTKSPTEFYHTHCLQTGDSRGALACESSASPWTVCSQPLLPSKAVPVCTGYSVFTVPGPPNRLHPTVSQPLGCTLEIVQTHPLHIL